MPLTPERLSRVAVVTRDRPALAVRCLESYGRNAKAHGRSPELVLHDDSADPAARRAMRVELTALGRMLGLNTSYAGFEEKRAYAQALVEAGAPRPSVEFALFGDARLGSSVTIGANRNSVLLGNAGGAVFMTDDDAVCRLAQAPGAEDGLRFAGKLSGIEYWFYPSQEKALAACPEIEADLLGLHEAVLGRSVRELEGGKPREGAASGRARLSLNGYLGDGGASSRVLLHLRGGSRDRLLASSATFDKAVRTRLCCRAAPLRTVTEGAYFMGAFAGLDLSEPLPPFPPLGRGEDTVFGALRWACRPDDFAVVLPVVGLHDPRPARVYTESEMFGADLIAADVLAAAAFAQGPTTCGALGAALCEAAADEWGFPSWFDGLLRPRYEKRVAEFQDLLEEFPDAPAYWRRRVEKALVNWSAAAAGSRWRPVDLGEGQARPYVAAFGALLRDWEAVTAAAVQARQSNIQLCV